MALLAPVAWPLAFILDKVNPCPHSYYVSCWYHLCRDGVPLAGTLRYSSRFAYVQILGREVGNFYTRSELKHLIQMHVENPEHPVSFLHHAQLHHPEGLVPPSHHWLSEL